MSRALLAVFLFLPVFLSAAAERVIAPEVTRLEISAGTVCRIDGPALRAYDLSEKHSGLIMLLSGAVTDVGGQGFRFRAEEKGEGLVRIGLLTRMTLEGPMGNDKGTLQTNFIVSIRVTVRDERAWNHVLTVHARGTRSEHRVGSLTFAGRTIPPLGLMLVTPIGTFTHEPGQPGQGWKDKGWLRVEPGQRPVSGNQPFVYPVSGERWYGGAKRVLTPDNWCQIPARDLWIDPRAILDGIVRLP